MAGRRLDQLTNIADGAVTGGLMIVAYDPTIAVGMKSAVRFTVDALKTYISSLSAVLSCFGRTGHVVADPGDYTELTTLKVTTFSMVCADDASVKQIKLRKLGTEYVLEVVQ